MTTSSEASALVTAIRTGDVAALQKVLAENPGVASSPLGGNLGARTPLHVVTDWPGFFPNGPAVVRLLIAAGADPNARSPGQQFAETPLHWAASSDDVEVLDALLDAGADLEAGGGVVAGGTPLADATAFAQWETAR
ncbi:MAG TPA: ankyrin repeat domain-containing protein, partial [Chloroflexota bacterium]